MGDYTKRTVSSGAFVKHAVAFLNELVQSDPTAIDGLIPPEGPDASVGGLPEEARATIESPSRMSVVGVLNSILARAGSREFIGHCEDASGCIVGFQAVPAAEVERFSRQPH